MNFLQRLATRIFFGSHSVFESANRSPRRAEVPGSGPRDTSLDLTPGVRSELVRRSRYLVKNSGFLQTILGGKLVKIQPDEAIESFQSNRPSPTFQGFLDFLHRDSALGLLPYEFASDSSKIGGAGVRLTVAKADRRFSRRQSVLIDRMLRPIWHFVIGHAITAGKLPPAEDWTEVDFVTPRRVTVDAGREAQQNREDVKAGLKTLTDHFAELGCDIHHELEPRAREMALVKEIADKYGVSPQDLYQSFTQTTP